ncbi:MAG: sulfonate transport system substrate-binding protein [Actinomycetota bacterium]|nr:sulfonate transport system substrate-binding protein [Actinomycetota bacterium]
MKMHRRMRTGVAVGLLAALALAGCGSDSKKSAEGGAVKGAEKVTLRLGYFTNITHASALVGLEKGIFADKLGPNVTLTPSVFAAGPAAVEAIFSGAIDATYVGPNPAINAFAKSNGEAVRIISGATSGGAFLVVNPSIAKPADLKGKKVATPQLGNTQDVALRSWLKANKLSSDTQGGGDVSVVPQDNAQALEAFKAGSIAGAWVPEPWATRMVQEGKGKVLVDEKTLWPGGQFVTTQLMVRTAFLKDHPDVVQHLLEGQVAATDFLNANPAEAKTLANQAIQKVAGKALPQAVLDAAWPNMTFTNDPIAASLRKGADNAKAVGLLDAGTKLDGIYDLTLLNKVLKAAGKPEVKS